MNVRHIGWLLLLVVLLLVACSGEEEPRPVTESGPRNVIAFGAQGPEGHGLYFVRPDGLGLTLLSPEAEPVSVPVWSPGGGRIAYVTGPAGGPAPVTLRIYDFATQTSTTVSSLAVAGAGDSGPAANWSPDGRRLAFTELAADEARIRVFDADGGELAEFPLVAGAGPDWSPDGGSLAFVRGGERRGLYVMDADGTGPELLAGGQLQSPRWSPDGERIVVTEVGEDGDAATLLIVERASGDTAALPGRTPAWSPDGRLLAFSAFSASAETGLDVFFVVIDVGDASATGEAGERQPLGQSVTRDLWPTWSPDGARVAFISQVDIQTAFICLVTLEPEQRDCLSLPDVVPTTPAWSPQ